MKKEKRERKFNRPRDQRRAFKKSLAVALISRGRIQTTLPRAKELRPFIEKLITKAKKQNLAALRYLLRFLPKKNAQKLIKEIAPQFKDRPGGYTRIIRLSRRKSDGAHLAFIEFVNFRQDQKYGQKAQTKSEK